MKAAARQMNCHNSSFVRGMVVVNCKLTGGLGLMVRIMLSIALLEWILTVRWKGT